MCSQDDHVKENILISGFEEEKSFEGDIKDWILFSQKEGRHYISFLEYFSYMLEIHLENISKT
jgi:hypothetical protein